MSTIKIAKIPQFGEAGEHVYQYQLALERAGYRLRVYGPDKAFGTETKEVGAKFQKKHGMKGTGLPGPNTLKLLGLEVDTRIPVEAPKVPIPSKPIRSPRTIPAALVKIIDDEIDTKAFKAAMEEKDFQLMSMLTGEALDRLKIRERTNNNDGLEVELIQKVCGGKRGYAWCVYAGQAIVAYVEVKTGVVSRLPASGSCATMRAKMPKDLIIDPKDLQSGDQVIWLYPAGNGHYGTFVSWLKKMSKFRAYEGNTTKGLVGGKINREGGGFYLTERDYVIPGMVLKMAARPF